MDFTVPKWENGIIIYSTKPIWRYVAAEQYIRIFQNKIHK